MRGVTRMSFLAIAGMLLAALTGAAPASAQTAANSWITAYVNPATNSPAAFGNDVYPTTDGGYALAGSIQFLFGNGVESASWLAKTDAAGNIAWENDYYAVNAGSGRPYPSAFSALAQAADGGFTAVGYTDEYNNSDNVWLVKTDASGTVTGCKEAHPATITTLGGGLTASAPSLPVATPAAAGAAISGGTTAATLTTHKDC